MITEVDLKHLDNLPIKVNKKKPPQSGNKDLPPFFLQVCLLVQKTVAKLIV